MEYLPRGTSVGREVRNVALPCATQNEINGEDAKTARRERRATVVAEGANMPCDPEALRRSSKDQILYGPGKAANAGGVAICGLEMAQNAGFTAWTREMVDERLLGIMTDIHQACRDAAEQYGEPGNYVTGANIAGFLKVGRAMVDQGIV